MNSFTHTHIHIQKTHTSEHQFAHQGSFFHVTKRVEGKPVIVKVAHSECQWAETQEYLIVEYTV